MEISLATAWWIAAGVLVAVELATGTFYLLMLALGCAAGALAAHFGMGFTPQLLAAAIIGGAAVMLWHQRRLSRPAPMPAGSNPDVNLDIGQAVTIDAWQPDGSALVHYRGANWQTRFVGSSTPAPGRHVIRGIEGSCLLVDR